jgi:hypothetical protein
LNPNSFTGADDGIIQNVSLERLSPRIAVAVLNPPTPLFVPETVSRLHDIVVELRGDHHVPGLESCRVLSTQKSVSGAPKDPLERWRFGGAGPGLDQVFCRVGRIGKVLRRVRKLYDGRGDMRIHTDTFNRALKGQDYAALEGLYADDYMLVRPAGSVLNKQEVLQDLRSGGLRFHSIELGQTEVRMYGSTTVFTAESQAVRSRDGMESRSHFRLIAVYVLEGRSIKLVHFQSSLLR